MRNHFGKGLVNVNKGARTSWLTPLLLVLSTLLPQGKLTGSACDRYCRGWVQRKPSSRETLQNPSPLLLAGEDTLPAPPGKVRELAQRGGI